VAKRKIGLFGVGPWLVLIGIVYFLNAEIISLDHAKDFRMLFVSRQVDAGAGMILFAFGFLVFIWAQAVFLLGWHKDQLVTTGPFRLCRHPMYAAWILIMLPAVGLIAHSWLVMANVAVVYVAFKLLIPREDRKLEAAFASDYLAYRSQTHELLPWLRPKVGRQ
jgi:protein-S-isoprenylcysteine O-methyltransferase Ste14